MADQCSCCRVGWRLVACCAVFLLLSTLVTKSDGAKTNDWNRGSNDEVSSEASKTGLTMLDRIRRSAENTEVERKTEHIVESSKKLKNLCRSCLRICKCEKGKATSDVKDSRKCKKCCSKPKCIYESHRNFITRRNKNKSHSTSHVYLRVVANVTEFRRIHYPKVAREEAITFRNNDVLNAKNEITIAGERVKHGWIESLDHQRTNDSPKLFYDNIRVRLGGLYLAYAQVVFRYERSQHSSYILVKIGPNRERVVLAQCEGTSALLKGVPGYQSSCFTQTVAFFEKGSKIRVECQYLNKLKCPKIVMAPNKTFFGVVRLSD